MAVLHLVFVKQADCTRSKKNNKITNNSPVITTAAAAATATTTTTIKSTRIALPPQSWLGTRRAVSSLEPQRERGGCVSEDEYSSALLGKREVQCSIRYVRRPIPRLK